MEILAEIDYYGSGVAVFDPQKVLERLEIVFPTINIDSRDLAQDEVERLIAFLDTSEVPEHARSNMLRQIRDKAARNGPIYKFQLETPRQGTLIGYVRRYSVAFRLKEVFNSELEHIVIRFLHSLKLGEIRSNTQTVWFQTPHPYYPESWVVSPEILLLLDTE